MRRIVPVLLLIGGVAAADVPVEVPPTAGAPKQQQPPKKGTKRGTKPPAPPPAQHHDRYAQQPGMPSEPPVAAVVVAHKEGDYGGVTPGTQPSTEPHGHRVALAAKGTLSWIGFEAKDGGAQVFLQSVAPFEVTQQVVGAQLFVYAALPRLAQNAWRQVDTRYFDNPLAGIQARVVGAAKAGKDHPGHGAGVEIRIAFKNPKDVHEATVRSATEADNLAYVYLAFPEGTAAAPAAATTAVTKDPEK